MSRLERILIPSIALIAVAGLALGVLDRVQLHSQVGNLSAQVRRQHAEIDALHSSLASLQTVAAHSATSQNLSKLQSGLAQLQLCVPQIEQQLNGLTVQLNTQGGFVTDAYLSNPTIISANCTKTLNGS